MCLSKFNAGRCLEFAKNVIDSSAGRTGEFLGRGLIPDEMKLRVGSVGVQQQDARQYRQ
jgi:hypothetical protein